MTAIRRNRTLVAVLGTIAVVVVAALVLIVTTPSRQQQRHRQQQRNGQQPRATPFALNSIWNAPLSDRAPIAGDSSTLVANLDSQVSEFGPWINSYSYSTPVYTVPKGQPRVRVVLDMPAGSPSVERLRQAFAGGVPIPPHATAAPGTDAAMVVYQPSTNTMWELWIAHRVGGTWHAQWGGEMPDVSGNPGYFPNGWGTAATGLALLGGTITPADLRSGDIRHALAISIPDARAGVYASPAQRTDGKLDSPTAIPEGTRFRLDPKLDVASLHLPPVTRMLADAAQRYGIFVRDQGGSVSFYAQQTVGSDPYYGPHGLFGGIDPRHILDAFPWTHLQVVRAPLHSAAG